MSEIKFSAQIISASANPLRFDADKCIGCHRCVEACQIDVLLPVDRRGKPPKVYWPGECWYCGACVMECPVPGAITLTHPIMNQARFIEKTELTSEEQ